MTTIAFVQPQMTNEGATLESAADSLLSRSETLRTHMLEWLGELVECESPSDDFDALESCAQLVVELWHRQVGRCPEIRRVDGRPHVFVPSRGAPRVLLLGHFDTVWPVGTLDELPFTVSDDVIRGPGTLDMKAGIVQALGAVTLLGDPDGVCVLLTSDEELSDTGSEALIVDMAREGGAVLVCEPCTPDGSVKIARRGIAHYRVTAHGRAAHAGEEPEYGINATLEIAAQVPAIARLASGDQDTTVTPTVLRAGSASNAIPDTGVVDVDVRAWTRAELERVDRQVRELSPLTHRDAKVTVDGGISRGPFETAASQPLVPALEAAAAAIGLPTPPTVRWRSGSDANLTAAAGVPTLDGLGACGAHPHARDEHVIASTMPRQTALLASLIRQLVGAGRG